MQKNKKRSEITRELLLKHCEKYPCLLPQDLFKYIFQSSFGCEHMVSDEVGALEYIKKEYSEMKSPAADIVEALDGDYSRASLSALDSGMSAQTLARLFFLSAKKEEHGGEELEEKIEVAMQLSDEGALPFDSCDFSLQIDSWRAAKYPPVRHSKQFREKYHPSYRVISNRFADFFGAFSKIDRLLAEKDRVVIAIEGGSASGKTSLAAALREVYSSAVIHMDDFFLRSEQRTALRLREVGGNIDRERFLEEIITPLLENKLLRYRRFDCSKQRLGEEITVEPSRLTVIEGVYSMHPSFGNYCDYSLFLDIDAEYQRRRIMKRNLPELAKRFFEEWIPLENAYFDFMDIKERCSESFLIREKDF